jgi:hypothetical protein
MKMAGSIAAAEGEVVGNLALVQALVEAKVPDLKVEQIRLSVTSI